MTLSAGSALPSSIALIIPNHKHKEVVVNRGRLSEEGGFSLLELLAVLLIISILVGMATVSYSFSVSRARSTACRGNLKVIRGALEAYYAKEGHYPPSLEDLVPEYIGEGFKFTCPASSNSYEYDPVSGKVRCPEHEEF